MLYEISCDKFAERVDGKLVQRAPIRFGEGLNTILGDKKAQNSIGKSTFLLIIDFCFGGEDYVDSKVNNAKDFVHEHVINFAFKFDDKIEYYSRSVVTPYEVSVCDDKYNSIAEPMGIDDFRNHLRDMYGIDMPGLSFRSAIGRYMRIYGKDNYDERHPLKYGDENVDGAIVALEKLFNVYDAIEAHKKAYTEKKNHKEVRKKATDSGDIEHAARTKTEVKQNTAEIEKLEKELEELTNNQDVDLSKQNTNQIDKAAEIKGKLTVLKRRRSRLASQLAAIENNLEGGMAPTDIDIQGLREFFPDINVDRIVSIDGFHKKMQQVLTGEMNEEIENISVLIEQVSQEVQNLEDEQRKLGVPVNISKKYMERYVEIQRRIDELRAKNKGYETTTKLVADVKAAKEQLENARITQLNLVQQSINEEMTRINDFIYENAPKKHHAPNIAFDNAKSGNPTYVFTTPADGGTGTNYKGLIVYDLSVLSRTKLPAIAHDSLIFKNIGDLPIDQIMQLYKQSKKQIFIAFDKEDAFSEITQEIIRKTKVLELHADGGELFGWSWAEVSDK